MCGTCGEKIPMYAWRTTLKLAAFDFGRLRTADIHYHPCCYRPRRDIWISLWPLRRPGGVKVAREMFFQACRLAVHSQIEKFRADIFETVDASICPLTNKALTRSNAHVHHGFPYSFKNMVDSFLDGSGLDIMQVSYCLRRFSDPTLAAGFSEYHRQRANLTMVHKSANQQQLNEECNANLGSCFRCHRFSALDWIADLGRALCQGSFVSATEAKGIFCIKDLSQLWHMKRPNPVTRPNPGAHFAPMKLYLVSEIHSLVLARDGSAHATKERQAAIDMRYLRRVPFGAVTEYRKRLREAPSDEGEHDEDKAQLPRALLRRQKKTPRRVFLLKALEDAAAAM